MSLKSITKILVIILSIPSAGQDFSSFLRQVAENNPEIIAYEKMLEAKRAEARTNLYPPGPEASFGYMPGNRTTPGVKKTWSVSQRFDFPSKYLAMKNISRNTIALAEQEFELGRLNILLEAQLTLYDYLFSKKLLSVYEKRSMDCSDLLEAWKKKLEAGETTITEYNRIVLELSAINIKKSKTEARLKSLGQKLNFMAGGKAVIPDAVEYPDEITTAPDSLIGIKFANHPAFAIPVMEYKLSLGEVSLSRSSNLPGLMAGYSSEILPSEIFTGPVAGITIPLWANAGKVKSARAKSYEAEAAMYAEIERLKSEVRKAFSEMVSLKSALNDLKEILKTSLNEADAEKALTEGGITITEYFSLLGVVYEAEERLIETENEYCRLVTVLNDHLLPERIK